MKPIFTLTIACAILAGNSFAAESMSSKAVAAATSLLGALNGEQRAKMVFPFKDEAQKKRWSNLPTTMVKRNGLRMGDLSATQRDAVWSVLKSALSPSGYEKVRQIVEADEVLKSASNGRPMFGRDEYYVSIVGEPSTTEPWLIQFGGHHLGINITLIGENGTIAPSHTGAQPAIYQFEGKTIRPLGQENDKAFALINALDEAQRKKAILGAQMRDLVLGPGRDGPMIEPEGIKGADLTGKQGEMLLDLASEWTGIQSEAAAKAKLTEMKKAITETWFAWSGPTEPGSAAYFRIQGPTVFIEYAPQKLGGEPTKHIHTIYRDPTSEYGSGFLKK